MFHARILGAALAACLALPSAAHAADDAAAAKATAPTDGAKAPTTMHEMMHGGAKDGGMMGGGMMGDGMMDGGMMGAHGRPRCMHGEMMHMGGMKPNMVPVPMLPPGNAKLQLQMQAEILQKVGEIVARYAQQVKEPPPPPAP